MVIIDPVSGATRTRETGKLGVQSSLGAYWENKVPCSTGKAECLERAITEENPSAWLAGARTMALKQLAQMLSEGVPSFCAQ